MENLAFNKYLERQEDKGRSVLDWRNSRAKGQKWENTRHTEEMSAAIWLEHEILGIRKIDLRNKDLYVEKKILEREFNNIA